MRYGQAHSRTNVNYKISDLTGIHLLLQAITYIGCLAYLMLLLLPGIQFIRRKATMKKVISTLIALGFISTLLVNTSYAGGRHESGISPLLSNIM